MSNPYENLPEKAFWRPAVANLPSKDIHDLWTPKFEIKKDDKIVTFGSCFAQHFSKALVKNGYTWFDAQPVTDFAYPKAAKPFGFGVFSARTGNIYTAANLLQWVKWATTGKSPNEIWESEGRFFDPFRPAIEPNGFASEEELRESRKAVVAGFRSAIEKADIFVFTLGLTEGWVNKARKYAYPMCPGTIAGEFEPEKHLFRNFGFSEIQTKLMRAIELMRTLNPKLKILLTVSPVPLTATASGKHVLVATGHSKSVLRAVADEVATSSPDIDYFPSYEIITSPAFEGQFFEKNKRSVSQVGVDFVMQSFFACLHKKFGEPDDMKSKTSKQSENPSDDDENDAFCEERMLDAFS